MLTVNKISAYLGLMLYLLGIGISPMLKVPLKGNWNLYQTDSRLFLISFVLLAVCALCMYLRRMVAFRFTAWLLSIWSVLMALAVYFKSNHYFGSKFFDKLVANSLSYQWGWIVLLVAVILLLTSFKRTVVKIEA